MKNFNIDNVELAPVAEFDTETTSIYERFTTSAGDAVKAATNAVAKKHGPEADSVFQRIMGFITGRGKNVPETLSPAYVALNLDVDEAKATTISGCSSLLRVLLGNDYTTLNIKNPRQLRCLHLLSQAPEGIGISREELDNQVGATNSPDVIYVLSKKLARNEAMIVSEKRKVYIAGKAVQRGYYWMTSVGRLVAQDILAHAVYVHDAAAIKRNAHRQQADRQHLIAAFGNDMRARDTVLNTKKPHWVRLVCLLLWKGGWISRYDIERLIDAPNPPDVVAKLNHECGDEVVESESRSIIDRDGKECRAGYYRISADWVAKMRVAVHRAGLVTK